jgi:hypothetical protein
MAVFGADPTSENLKETIMHRLGSLALLLSIIPVAIHAQETKRPDPPVMKILAVGRPGTAPMTPEVRAKVLPVEVRETVKLYLAGKIDQWYYRKDNSSVVFILNVTTTEEARSLLESMPLGKSHVLAFDYVPLSPLVPLRLLVDQAASDAPSPAH